MRIVPRVWTQRPVASAVSPTGCLCGDSIEPVLLELGSTWCHDCRADARRRDLALEERLEPRAKRMPLRRPWRARSAEA